MLDKIPNIPSHNLNYIYQTRELVKYSQTDRGCKKRNKNYNW